MRECAAWGARPALSQCSLSKSPRSHGLIGEAQNVRCECVQCLRREETRPASSRAPADTHAPSSIRSTSNSSVWPFDIALWCPSFLKFTLRATHSSYQKQQLQTASHNILTTFTIVCWAVLAAILWPTGCQLNLPASLRLSQTATCWDLQIHITILKK